MSEFVQIEIQLSRSSTVTCAPTGRSTAVFWLQGITLIWMLVECGLSLYAAAAARSPALLAFGSDSFVELLSAGVVLLQFLPQVSISQRNAARAAGALLFALALIVCVVAIGSLALRLRPETSRLSVSESPCCSDRDAYLGQAEAPGSAPQQQCSSGCRRSAIGHMCLSGRYCSSWPGAQCTFPYRLV